MWTRHVPSDSDASPPGIPTDYSIILLGASHLDFCVAAVAGLFSDSDRGLHMSHVTANVISNP